MKPLREQTLTEKAATMRGWGYDPVVIKPAMCGKRLGPHVCANCPTRGEQA